MVSKPRAKASAGAGKSKAGRRTVRPKAGSGVPVMAVVAGVILGVLTIALIVTIVYLQRPQPGPVAVSGVPCDHLEQTKSHYHAALQIVFNGNVVNLPDNAGIQFDSGGTNVKCYYWLHVHATSKNVIHIEAPASQAFSLGQFVDVWNEWSQNNGRGAQKLDATHVSTFVIGPSDKVVTYIDLQDGKGPTVYTGDPRAIVLKAHEVITIAINPAADFKPPAFTFPAGT